MVFNYDVLNFATGAQEPQAGWRYPALTMNQFDEALRLFAADIRGTSHGTLYLLCDGKTVAEGWRSDDERVFITRID